MTDPPQVHAALPALLEKWGQPPEHLIGKLPRIVCGKCRDSATKCCADHTKRTCVDCGNYITERHIHLDYLGHAEVTKALLEADPEWSWEPVAFDDAGAPLIVQRGGTLELWIRLTVVGHTRLGVGTCTPKPDAAKELIGDALRNAAMRFGVALSLWSKEEWEQTDPPAVEITRDQAKRRVLHELKENGWSKEAALSHAAALMTSVTGDGPLPEIAWADVFAKASVDMPAKTEVVA